MEKAIVDLVQQLRDEVIANYKNKRLIASGNFERETVVVDGGDSVQIVAPHYVYQMVQGRRGGSAPPVSVIKQWIKDKNAQGADIPLEAAWAIVTKIKQDGIKVPNKFNDGTAVKGVINPQRVQQLTTDISEIIKARILQILTK